MNLWSRATGPFAPARLSQRALVIGCFSKLTPFMRPDVRIFYRRPPLCAGVEGEGRRWGANREIARVSSISRSLTPRFRSATIILSRERGEGKNEASFHDPVATLDNARIDDQPSQQKSWETKRCAAKQTRLCMRACVCAVWVFVLVLSFILENSREKGEFLQGYGCKVDKKRVCREYYGIR